MERPFFGYRKMRGEISWGKCSGDLVLVGLVCCENGICILRELPKPYEIQYLEDETPHQVENCLSIYKLNTVEMIASFY